MGFSSRSVALRKPEFLSAGSRPDGLQVEISALGLKCLFVYLPKQNRVLLHPKKYPRCSEAYASRLMFDPRVTLRLKPYEAGMRPGLSILCNAPRAADTPI